MANAPAPSELLDRIIETSGADGFQLPPLVVPRDDGPSYLQRLLKWFSDLFPQKRNVGGGEWLALVLKVVAILGVVMILVALVSIVISAMRRAARRAQDAKFGLRRGKDEPAPREKLHLLLDQALQAGRLGEAARLRWKIHLMRKSLPGSITPGETEGFGKFYPLMFGTAEGESALKQFGELESSLRSRETSQ